MTDTELRLALAKMLPEKIHIRTIDFIWKDNLEAILDTEWLHVCWLVEQTLGSLLHGYWHCLWDICEPNFPFRATRTHFDFADFDSICHASWQQRAEALIKVKGMK